MTHQEMRPELWDKMIEQKIKRDKSKYEEFEAATDNLLALNVREMILKMPINVHITSYKPDQLMNR